MNPGFFPVYRGITLSMNRIKNSLTAIFTIITIIVWQALTGCAKVGPDYLSPQSSAPAAWNTSLNQGLDIGPADRQVMAEWWTLLNDPLLNNFIQQAIAGNLDLEQARARLLQARANRDIVKPHGSTRLRACGTNDRELFGSQPGFLPEAL